MELDKERAERHAKTLVEAEQAWFYGYNWERSDQERLINAFAFFETTKERLADKLEKEGK